jgi:hypothetical protein
MQLPGTLFFGAPEAHPIFLGLRFGFGASAFLAIAVEIDDHLVGKLRRREMLNLAYGAATCGRAAIFLLLTRR